MTTAEKPRQWLTIRDLEDEYGIEAVTVYNLRHRGDFPTGYRVGNRLRFKRTDIEAFIASKADKPRVQVAG
jgi:predicted DNA-binding transcriptional regulator AlpA